ncbi:MAG TPA: FAD-dependent oxidoreductase [Anaerolineae bacterium]|nr:FAD-dependent oxidoreductase [Anaerolineae bacterium]HQK15313.1 FAD-dependent oxidoreductase [Anaerolineae bacterium]
MRFVIVGGGVAGITAALELANRKSGSVEVYSDEEYPYYYRPQLTEFLAGGITLERLLRRDLTWYKGRGIDVYLGCSVTRVDAGAHTITLADGTQVTYDRLLLATGSIPFVPPLPGSDKNGVFTWRTLADTLELERRASACGQTIVLGGGLLGLEAARGLLGFCGNVTVLEFFPRLLPRQLDVEGATLLQQFVESLGIKVVVGAQTEAFLGERAVTGVRLKDGREFPAGLVLVAAGVRCNARLAQEAGLTVDRGIVVDDHMATSAPDIYAAGDVAVYKGYTWAIAPIAQAQGRTAAVNMAGEATPYDVVVPSTTLKVVGIDVSSVGMVNPETEDYTEIRAFDAEARTYKKIVLHDGRIVGSIVINDKKLAKDLEDRIARRETLTPDQAQALLD